jgi:hypothetical protein
MNVNFVPNNPAGVEVNRLNYQGPIQILPVADLRYDFFIEVGIANQHSRRIYSMPRIHRSKSTFVQANYPAKGRADVTVQNLNRGFGAFTNTIMNFKLKDTPQSFNFDLLNTQQNPFMRYGKELNSGDWGTINELEVNTLDNEIQNVHLTNYSEPVSIPGEFYQLNETLHIIEEAASHISEYKDPSSSNNPFVGDSWGLVLLQHLREVAIGHFARIKDFENRNAIGKYREVHEIANMFNQALRNSLDNQVENPNFIK